MPKRAVGRLTGDLELDLRIDPYLLESTRPSDIGPLGIGLFGFLRHPDRVTPDLDDEPSRAIADARPAALQERREVVFRTFLLGEPDDLAQCAALGAVGLDREFHESPGVSGHPARACVASEQSAC